MNSGTVITNFVTVMSSLVAFITLLVVIIKIRKDNAELDELMSNFLGCHITFELRWHRELGYDSRYGDSLDQPISLTLLLDRDFRFLLKHAFWHVRQDRPVTPTEIMTSRPRVLISRELAETTILWNNLFVGDIEGNHLEDRPPDVSYRDWLKLTLPEHPHEFTR